MLTIFFALITFLAWGTGDIFTTLASRKMGSYNASFYGFLVSAIISTLYIPFVWTSIQSLSFSVVLITIILSVIQLFAFLAYNEALKIGNSSLVGTIAGAFTGLVVILSVLFLGESLSTQQILAIIVIFVGLVFASLRITDIQQKKIFSNKGILYALIAMAGWAIYFTFIKIPVKQVGFFWPSYITSITGSVCFLLWNGKKVKKPAFQLQSGFPAVFFSGTLLTIGALAFNLAISQGSSSITASIAGAYPALFAFLAYYIFHDPITKQQKGGMVITLFGIILLAYLGG